MGRDIEIYFAEFGGFNTWNLLEPKFNNLFNSEDMNLGEHNAIYKNYELYGLLGDYCNDNSIKGIVKNTIPFEGKMSEKLSKINYDSRINLYDLLNTDWNKILSDLQAEAENSIPDEYGYDWEKRCYLKTKYFCKFILPELEKLAIDPKNIILFFKFGF